MGLGLGIIVTDKKDRLQVRVSATGCRINYMGDRALVVPDRHSSVKEGEVVEITRVTHYLPGNNDEYDEKKNGIFFVACRTLNDQQLIKAAEFYQDGIQDQLVLVNIEDGGNPIVRPAKVLIEPYHHARLHVVFTGEDQRIDLTNVTYYNADCFGGVYEVRTAEAYYSAWKHISTSGVKVLRSVVDERVERERQERTRQQTEKNAADLRKRCEEIAAWFTQHGRPDMAQLWLQATSWETAKTATKAAGCLRESDELLRDGVWGGGLRDGTVYRHRTTLVAGQSEEVISDFEWWDKDD